MMTFWVVAVSMLSVTLWWLLSPLFKTCDSTTLDRRQQNIEIARSRLSQLKQSLQDGAISEQAYTSEKKELEQSLALDLDSTGDLDTVKPAETIASNALPVLALALTFAIPALLGILYIGIGNPSAITIPPVQGSSVNVAENQDKSPSVEEMMARLKQQLEENPDDLRGWQIFARSSMALQSFSDAVRAYSRINELSPNNPDILVGLADAMAMVEGGVLLGKPKQLLANALKIDSGHVQGLWLSGMAAQQNGSFQVAMDFWQTLLPKLVQEPQSQTELSGLIKELEAQAQQAGISLTKANNHASSQSVVLQTSISVSVSLNPDLLDQTQPEQIVFIFARAISGPPMPLAAARHRVDELPITIVLDDSSAMIPGMQLSGFNQVEVVARISKSGQPIANSGDLEAISAPVNTNGAIFVELVISKVLP